MELERRVFACLCLLLSDSNGRTDGHDFCQSIHVLIVHANTAARYILADRGRIVRAVNAVVRLAQSHPEGAEYTQRTSRIGVRMGDFVDDGKIPSWCRCGNFAQGNRIRADELVSIE